ncbi:MAG TPA: hypothetical protein V6C76_02975 [Drouetiella sp.]
MATFGIALWVGGSQSTFAAETGKPLVLKPDEELNVNLSTSLNGKCNVRVNKEYLFVDLPQHQIELVAKAPEWNVEAISEPRKLTGKCTLEEFVRRGSPLNFLKIGSVPEWPLIPQPKTTFNGWVASAYAMPFKTQKGDVVPLSRGRVGNVVVLGAGVIPMPACRIISTLIQTPKVDGITVKLFLTQMDASTTKMNSVFLFSGMKRTNPKEVDTLSAAIAKRKPLPSVKGYKVCKDPRDVWVSHADTEGFEGLMR